MYIREKIEESLRKMIAAAVDAAVAEGAFPVESLPEIQLEVPREEQFGDYSTNIAMQLPKQARKAPRVIAEAIVAHLDTAGTYVEKADIAGPGFINFHLDPSWHYEVIADIEERGDDYGRTTGHAGGSHLHASKALMSRR